MITLTISEKKKVKNSLRFVRCIKMFKSKDKANKFIVPIVEEMKQAKLQKRDPNKAIVAVSYETKSEKNLLLELGAITSIDNENEDSDY